MSEYASSHQHPVLLLHGWGGSFESDWVRTGMVAALRAKGRTSVAIDILGHGSAEKPEHPTAYGDLAGDVARQLPAGPLDAIGFSLGGKLLLDLASRHPDLFNRIVIVGVGVNAFKPEASAFATLAALDAHVAGDDLTPDALADYALGNGNSALAVAACLRRPHNPILTSENISGMHIPTLVIAGKQDLVTQSVEPLVEALPNATLVLLEGVGHLDLLADPRCIHNAVQFLAPVNSSARTSADKNILRVAHD